MNHLLQQPQQLYHHHHHHHQYGGLGEGSATGSTGASTTTPTPRAAAGGGGGEAGPLLPLGGTTTDGIVAAASGTVPYLLSTVYPPPPPARWDNDDNVALQPQHQHQPRTRPATTTASTSTAPARKKRYCLFPGCLNVVKSQGHCQKHGALPKRCKAPGCDRQAQGKHDGMCKRHYKESQKPPSPPPTPAAASEDATAKKARNVKSVYESVLPNSITWVPLRSPPRPNTVANAAAATSTAAAGTKRKSGRGQRNRDPGVASPLNDNDAAGAESAGAELAIASASHKEDVMPLILYLRKGRKKASGWHRRDERIAADAPPVSIKSQLEPWEKRLALVEILLLSGGTPGADFRDLAHAWGREKGFHHHLSSTMCERRGDVERKVRSDRGKDKKRTVAVAAATKSDNTAPIPPSLSVPEGGTVDEAGDNDPSRQRPAKRPNRTVDEFQDFLASETLDGAVL